MKNSVMEAMKAIGRKYRMTVLILQNIKKPAQLHGFYIYVNVLLIG